MTDRVDRRPALWQRGAAVALLLAGAGLLVVAVSLAGAVAHGQPGGDLPLAAIELPATDSELPATASELPAAAAEPAVVVAEPRLEVVGPPAAEEDTSPEVVEPPAAVAPAPRPVAVEVPGIGVHSELVELGLDTDQRLEVPADAELAGWWMHGVRPGDDGPAVIAGHVDSRRGPGVFHRLDQLAAGDEIVVRRKDDTEVRFAVDRIERWPKDGFPTEAVYLEADGPELRLITCGGEFDHRTRSYDDNIIVFASLAGR